MTPGQIVLILIVVASWTWFGGWALMDNMGDETPKGTKAVLYCIALGPILGTLLAGVILWEMTFGKEKEQRKKEEKKQYEGDQLLRKIKQAMDNPTYQFEVDGEWLPRDAAIKKLISNYFKNNG